MRKISSIFACLILSGCYYNHPMVGNEPILPHYFDKRQTISINNPTHLNIEGSNNLTEYQTSRSFFSDKIILSKKGFQDKELKIQSHLTDDKWAKRVKYREQEEKSAFTLLPPNNTFHAIYNDTVEGSILGMYAGGSVGPLCDVCGVVTIPVGVLIGGSIGIVIGVVEGLIGDIYNLVYTIPSVIITNPWYEYDKEIDLSREILIPTLEFEHQCHAKADMFIGNNDCVSCHANEIVISTQEECSRCPNRSWINNECSLKK